MDRSYRLLNWLRRRRSAARTRDAADMGIDWALELILADRAGGPGPAALHPAALHPVAQHPIALHHAARRHAVQATPLRQAPPPA